MASFVYTAAMQKMLLNGSVLPMDNTKTYKLMLVTSSQAAYKADTVVSTHLTGAELSVSGYVGTYGGAGRKGAIFSSTSPAIASNVVQIIFNASTIVWTALGTGGTIVGVALIYETGGSDATSIPIAYWDLSSNLTTNGSDITLTLSATGNIQITT